MVFASAAHASMLPNLPTMYIAAMVGAAAIYAACHGPETIGRCAAVLAPFTAAGLLLIYAPLPFMGHFGNLLPITPPPLHAWFVPQVMAGAGLARGFIPLLVLGPFTRRPQRVGPMVVANGLAWLLITMALVLAPVIFDVPLAQTFFMPFRETVGILSWRWLPIRNLVPITLLTWFTVAFTVFSTYLWMGSWVLARLFGIPHPWFAVVAGLGVTIISGLNVADPTLRTLVTAFNLAAMVLVVGVPTVMCLRSGRGTPAAGDRSPKGGGGKWRAGVPQRAR